MNDPNNPSSADKNPSTSDSEPSNAAPKPPAATNTTSSLKDVELDDIELIEIKAFA